MSKKKIAAILAAILAILGGVYALIDDDPTTTPDIPEIIETVTDTAAEFRDNGEKDPEVVVPAIPEVEVAE